MKKIALLSYVKDFNRKQGSKNPRTTVLGNVAIIFDEEIVDKFNIPTVTEDFIPVTRVKARTYTNDAGKLVTSPDCERPCLQLRTTLLATVHYQGKTYPFDFPWFFNFSMVNQGLYALLQYSNKLDELYFTYRNRTRKHWVTGEPSDWGIVELGKLPLVSNNTEKTSQTPVLAVIYNAPTRKIVKII
jgi:hypothetical protein